MQLFSNYEQAEATKIAERKRDKAERAAASHSWVPEAISEAPTKAVELLRKAPGGVAVVDLATSAYQQAFTGLAKALVAWC